MKPSRTSRARTRARRRRVLRAEKIKLDTARRRREMRGVVRAARRDMIDPALDIDVLYGGPVERTIPASCWTDSRRGHRVRAMEHRAEKWRSL